jgi:hypothetical protein
LKKARALKTNLQARIPKKFTNPNCERNAHASPPTFVLTTQRLEYLAILQRNQDSISRWNAKVGGQATLNYQLFNLLNSGLGLGYLFNILVWLLIILKSLF